MIVNHPPTSFKGEIEMLVSIYAKEYIVRKLLSMKMIDLTVLLAKIAASPEVDLLDVSALKELLQLLKEKKDQDVFVIEKIEKMDETSSYWGPWHCVLNVHGTNLNPQLTATFKSDETLKPAAGHMAEMLREQIAPEIDDEKFAGLGHIDLGGFKVASKKNLAARRAYLQLSWFKKLLHNLFRLN